MAFSPDPIGILVNLMFRINQYLGTYFRDQDEALRVQRKNMETVFQDHMNEIIAEVLIPTPFIRLLSSSHASPLSGPPDTVFKSVPQVFRLSGCPLLIFLFSTKLVLNILQKPWNGSEVLNLSD